ncbi:MAG TPA: PIG-L family deacetylase [Spirochaetia bacterium]|nr:PIG-L family deacetylase [Spirochaetia bacterium]
MADILVFGAHPDDAEFGMGASMVKFVRTGASVALCVLTRGEAGTFGNGEMREQEMREAARRLGGEIEILSFSDCAIFDTYEARVILAEVIRRHRPKLIFAPYHTNPGSHKDGGAHPDHWATGAIVRSATRYARFAGLKEVKGEPWNPEYVLYYMMPRNRVPTLVNDVSEYIEEWESIARSHQSQLAIRDGKVLEFLRKLREQYGSMIGARYGEGFLTDEPVPFELDVFLRTPAWAAGGAGTKGWNEPLGRRPVQRR